MTTEVEFLPAAAEQKPEHSPVDIVTVGRDNKTYINGQGVLFDMLPADFLEMSQSSAPVMTFRRTATKETELGGRKIMPGDKVVMFYPLANRETDVFQDPDTFDLSRDPNPHVGLGGGGAQAHFCLGNQLAKSMLRALFHELLTRIPAFEAGEPELLGTKFHEGRQAYALQVHP